MSYLIYLKKVKFLEELDQIEELTSSSGIKFLEVISRAILPSRVIDIYHIFDIEINE